MQRIVTGLWPPCMQTLDGIASRKPCTILEMFLSWKFKGLGSGPGSRLLSSQKLPLQSISPNVPARALKRGANFLSLPCMFSLPSFHEKHCLVCGRRLRSKESRGEKWNGMRPRRPKTFLASWSSAQPRASSSCQTHKESEQHITAAARTAGYLLAVSASGLLFTL